MSEIILTTKTELRSEIIAAIKDYDASKKENTPIKLYTINQIAKKLGKAHSTIKKLVAGGSIRSTKSGLIPEDAINEYLKG